MTVLLLGWAAAATDGAADPRTSHRVTVRVARVSSVAVLGGDITLTLSRAPDDTGLSRASDSGTCAMTWATNQNDQKVTVATNLEAPRFSLAVEGRKVAAGTAVGLVSVDTMDRQLVVDIAPAAGGCDLAYSATTGGYSGPETDVHVVTCTITDRR